MKKIDVVSFVKRNRNFTFLWLSQALSQITLNMINFVMATRIYEKTGSTIAVSMLWVFIYLPAFLLGPFSGYFVDLIPLRKMLIWTNFLQGLVMLLFLFAKNSIYPIYPVVFLFSLLNQFYFPAEASALVWLVPKQDLPLANSLFMLTSQSSLIAGLGVSGILMRLFGKDNPIYLSSAGLFLAALAVYFLPKTQLLRKKGADTISKFFKEIKFGYSFIVNHRLVLFPIILQTFFQAFVVVLAVTIPGFASQLLNIEVADAGPLLIVPLGFGALTGIYLMARFFHNLRKKKLMRMGFFVCLLVFIIFWSILPLLGAYKSPVSTVLMYFLGIGGFFIFIPNQTLIQEHTPLMLRGRVFGALGFIITLVTLPLLLFSATIVDTIGVRFFMLFPAIFMFMLLLFLDKAEEFIIKEKNGTL